MPTGTNLIKIDAIQLEYKLQAFQQLTENIKALTKKYPSRDDLTGVLNKYMFYHININALNELVYYLSNLEYMAKTEDVFVNWPLTDNNEKCLRIIEHVTKLNNIYKGANIPIPSLELLFLPQGIKIVNFFLKWSELCMLEHLRTLPNIFPQILHRIKPNKDPAQTEVMLKVMQEQVAGINIEISSMINKFIEKKKLKENELSIIKGNQEEFILESNKTDAGFNLSKECYDPISELIQYSHEFQSYFEIFHEIEKIRPHFINEKKVLVHHQESFEVPYEVEHIIKNADTLNWFEYFFGLKKFLDNRMQDLLTSSRICSEASEKAKQLIQICLNVKDKLKKKIDAFKSELEKIHEDNITALDRFDLLITPLVE